MFTVYGPGVTDPMRLEKLLTKPDVHPSSKVQQVLQTKLDDAEQHQTSASMVHHLYRQKEQERDRRKTLHAAQVMMSPVIFLYAEDTLAQANQVLEKHGFRHIPLLSQTTGQLLGMVSDRDVYRCQCALHDGHHSPETTLHAMIQQDVVAAHPDADVRDIARMFVEQRLGAMPIVAEDALVGMITRSDILRVVMAHLDLDVWE